MHEKYADYVHLGTILLKIEKLVSQVLPLFSMIISLHVNYAYIRLNHKYYIQVL